MTHGYELPNNMLQQLLLTLFAISSESPCEALHSSISSSGALAVIIIGKFLYYSMLLAEELLTPKIEIYRKNSKCCIVSMGNDRQYLPRVKNRPRDPGRSPMTFEGWSRASWQRSSKHIPQNPASPTGHDCQQSGTVMIPRANTLSPSRWKVHSSSTTRTKWQ